MGKWCYAASSMLEFHRPPLRQSGDRKLAPYPDTGPESRGEGWHPKTSNDQASFSYPGAPAPAGMSDWHESMSRTPILDRFRHGLTTPETAAPKPPPLARSATPAKACPVPRYGAEIQWVGGGTPQNTPYPPGFKFGDPGTTMYQDSASWTVVTAGVLTRLCFAHRD